MRILKRNSIITIKAAKKHPQLILSESGRNYQIISDMYTNGIPFAEWCYWVLKPKGYKYLVLRVYKL